MPASAPARGLLVAACALAVVASSVWGVAPSEAVTLRLASLSQWVIAQHSRGAPSEQPTGRGFPAVLDQGVVDRVVFWWQRGVIQRGSLVDKPVRVLPEPEANALGGRGEFELVGVRYPSGRSAWTEIEVRPRTARPEDVLVLEVGGERATVSQVLETALVGDPGGTFRALALVRRAVIPGEGVPIVTAPFGRPVERRDAAGLFFEARGLGLLVARSPIRVIVNGAFTPRGLADQAASDDRDWREGDRLFIRASLAALRAGSPMLVLGWKDRTPGPEPDREELPLSGFGPRWLR